jgi:hypothetical protein
LIVDDFFGYFDSEKERNHYYHLLAIDSSFHFRHKRLDKIDPYQNDKLKLLQITDYQSIDIVNYIETRKERMLRRWNRIEYEEKFRQYSLPVRFAFKKHRLQIKKDFLDFEQITEVIDSVEKLWKNAVHGVDFSFND